MLSAGYQTLVRQQDRRQEHVLHSNRVCDMCLEYLGSGSYRRGEDHEYEPDYEDYDDDREEEM
jgi:hypothetical protein